MTMKDLARHIIAVGANQVNPVPVTSLQVQKVMYFSLKNGVKEGVITQRFVESEYDQPFVTWPYGPVVPEVYFEFNHFGRSPIRLDDNEYNERFSGLDGIILDLLSQNIFSLVEASHKEPIWANNEDGIYSGDVRQEYSCDEVVRV